MEHRKRWLYAVLLYDLIALGLLLAFHGLYAPAAAALPAVTPAAALEAAPEATLAPPPTPAPTATPTPYPGPRETRAVWVSRWEFAECRDVERIVERADYANLNVILFQVRGQADALYRPGLEPWSALAGGAPGRDPGWDPLAEIIALAHARGIEVHAWINAYPAGLGSPPPAWVQPQPMWHEFNARYGNQWLLWQGGGPLRPGTGEYIWANPAHPAVVERVVEVCSDLLARYELDGLHLDYIRYAGGAYAYDPVSNRAYAAAAAERPSLSRADWQREQVTGLVERVRREALVERPPAQLTAAAWPIYEDRWGYVGGHDGYHAYYQDSQGWARAGTVDAIMPMLYGSSAGNRLDRFTTLARDHVQGAGPGGVVVGIGADYGSFAEVSARIAAARDAGAQGQALFSFGALERHGYWRNLREGPYAERAIPHWR